MNYTGTLMSQGRQRHSSGGKTTTHKYLKRGIRISDRESNSFWKRIKYVLWRKGVILWYFIPIHTDFEVGAAATAWTLSTSEGISAATAVNENTIWATMAIRKHTTFLRFYDISRLRHVRLETGGVVQWENRYSLRSVQMGARVTIE